MFYLVEECESKLNGVLRYTICSTEEQLEKSSNESTFDFADGSVFTTKEELMAWLHEFATVPKKA